MLKITIPKTEFYDSEKNEFVKVEEQELLLEHSLMSLRKWEQTWHVRFLDENRKLTSEQLLDYIRCMTIGEEPPLYVYSAIPSHELDRIGKYIKNPMTATTFSDIEALYGDSPKSKKKKGDKLSAEVIYYMMLHRGIPLECEKWHLNTLISLLNVYAYYEEKSQKESQSMNKKGKKRPSFNEMQLRRRLHEERQKERLNQSS